MLASNGDQQTSAFAFADINVNDLSVYESELNDRTVYQYGDFNMNGDITVNDLILYDDNQNMSAGVSRPE